MSVPSSKMMYTNEAPNTDSPRTTLDFGTASIAVVSG